jgi:hypothetical protein
LIKCLLVLLLTITQLYSLSKSETDEIYTLASYKNKEPWVGYYTNSVIRYSTKYNISPVLIARMIFRESYYNVYLNGKDGEHGPCQIKMIWDHNVMMKRTENYNPNISLHDNYHRISTSVELMVMIVSKYRNITHSDKMAVISYWRGYSSIEMKGYLNNTWDFSKTSYYKYCFVPGYIKDYILPKK